MPAAISVKNLRKAFDGGELYDNLSFEAERSAITAIFGPNGSGKSTILNILSGIVPHDGGSYEMPGLERFGLGYIFQNYRESLLPWRTNFENVALPLEIRKIPKREIRARIGKLECLLGMSFEWNRYPYELSGGQQQMLVFMRALVTEPKMLLIDEPFSALDYENNLRLRECLQAYHAAYGATVLMVTHNIEEAVHLADRILIFSKKPSAVSESMENMLPYPRSRNSLPTDGFHKAKDEALLAFQKAANL